MLPPPALTPELAQTAFDQLWEAFDRKYAMFVLRPEVDWAKSREQYRPKAVATKSAYEFAGVCAEMLKPLRDLHIWLTVQGTDMPVFNRARAANANRAAYTSILGKLVEAGRSVKWTVTPDKIGFIVIYSWNDSPISEQCAQALEQMRGTRGLILDVRLNGGGNESTAEKVAGRFLRKEFIYAYSQYRNGPSHTNLTEKFHRKVMPRGPWRYDRPVVLLIGEKCMSSNESFIGMMTGDPEVTTMGDHTCGSSGNPTMLELPLGMTVSVPQWIDYLPDGTPLDERGFRPQVVFKPEPGAFDGNRDDLLSAALDHLRQVPLPAKPIEGPAFMSDDQAEALDNSRPKVVAVTPANGADSVETDIQLRVRFDRPMDPFSLKLAWKSGGFLHCEWPKYDSDKLEFTLPMKLAPGEVQQVVITPPIGQLSSARAHYPLDGFLSTDRRLARLFTWTFRTKDAPSLPADAKAPRLLKLSPSPNSRVPFRTFLEVQFDQPMRAPGDTLPYLSTPAGITKPALIPVVQYDAASHAFRLPLLLPPREKTSFTLGGFCSAAGVPAKPVRIEYQVSEDELAPADRERLEANRNMPQLVDVLKYVRQKRMALTSLSERVQTLFLQRRDGRFSGLQSKISTFKWQQPNRYYADVSQEMSMMAFTIGCDGVNWWWHTVSERGNKPSLVVCPATQMHHAYTCICDPFGLTRKTPKEAASKLALSYAGHARLGDTDCHLFERWDIDKSHPEFIKLGSLARWWIDVQSGSLLEVWDLNPFYLARTRFLYDAVNQPLPPEGFAIPQLPDVPPGPPEALDVDYTARFVNARDGSDGSMSVRWGRIGPKGRSGGGLN